MSVYAVYASVEDGTAWRRLEVFDTMEAADQRAAEATRATQGSGTFALDGSWDYAEALVVELESEDEALEELALVHVVPIRSRFTRGADAPGPAMELSEENAFEMAGQP